MLSPPTASEPVKPVQFAATEVIKTLAATEAGGGSGSDGGSGGGSSSGGSGMSTTPEDNKAADKVDAANNDKTGTKNETVKKLYCN